MSILRKTLLNFKETVWECESGDFQWLFFTVETTDLYNICSFSKVFLFVKWLKSTMRDWIMKTYGSAILWLQALQWLHNEKEKSFCKNQNELHKCHPHVLVLHGITQSAVPGWGCTNQSPFFLSFQPPCPNNTKALAKKRS